MSSTAVPILGSIPANLALGATVFGAGLLGFNNSHVGKYFSPESGQGVMLSGSAVTAFTGAVILWNGVVTPLYAATAKKVKEFVHIMTSNTIRNDAVAGMAILGTGGSASLICLEAELYKGALGFAAVAGLALGYLYYNRNNLIQLPSDSPYAPFPIPLSSPLHLDYPIMVQIGKHSDPKKNDPIYYTSFGAAYEARKFLPAYREANFAEFQGKSAEELREKVSEAQGREDKNEMLAAKWREPGIADLATVNDSLRSLLRSKFGIELESGAKLTKSQKMCRAALLKTKNTFLKHPDIKNPDGSVALAGNVLSVLLMRVREHVAEENEARPDGEPKKENTLERRYRSPFTLTPSVSRHRSTRSTNLK